MPRRISRTAILAVALLLTFRMNAAELQPETVKAWDDYIHSAAAAMQTRAAQGAPFLWSDENPNRLKRVRNGEIQVAPAIEHGTQAVPNGLIHDWIGSVFIPDVTLRQVVEMTRDYAGYKDVFKPLVIDSRLLDRSGEQDRFSMRWVHKALFVTAAIDTQYEARGVSVSDRRYYTSSYSTKVQEIQEYGKPAERLLPSGQGSGLIWKLYSICRYEERDGGVYAEMEAFVLTRDIPASVRMVVRPIITKLSRNSLLVSLTQTRDAVQAIAKRSAPQSQITQKSATPVRGLALLQ